MFNSPCRAQNWSEPNNLIKESVLSYVCPRTSLVGQAWYRKQYLNIWNDIPHMIVSPVRCHWAAVGMAARSHFALVHKLKHFANKSSVHCIEMFTNNVFRPWH